MSDNCPGCPHPPHFARGSCNEPLWATDGTLEGPCRCAPPSPCPVCFAPEGVTHDRVMHDTEGTGERATGVVLICRTAEQTTFDIPSDSSAGVTYTVTIPADESRDAPHCTCPALKYRVYGRDEHNNPQCKHLERARAMRCPWRESINEPAFDDGGELHCPRCGRGVAIEGGIDVGTEDR